MTRKLKPVEVELSEEVQQAVLSLPVQNDDGSLSTVGDLIKKAADSIEAANQAIQDNALIQLTASHLMKQEKRRGNPSVVVKLDGTAVLLITYGESSNPAPPEPLAPRSKLPSLDVLRKKAEEMGVDISDLGRKKKMIIARLEDAENPRPPSKMRDEVSESTLTRHSLTGPSR